MYPQVFDNQKSTFNALEVEQPENAMPIPETAINLMKRGNALFLIYFLITIGGGVLRKWVFSAGVISNIILLALMVFPFFLLTISHKSIQSPFKKYSILTFLMVVLIYHIINPYQKTFFHGMLGILVHAPFWIGTFFILTNQQAFQLKQLRWFFIGLAIVEVVLCFVQYALPPGHILNKYAVERDEGMIATVGDAVRVTGTFSFLSGLTAYTVFHAFLCWAILRWRFPSWVFFTFLLSGLILCFMSGSRSGTFIYIGLSAGILLNEFPPGLLARFLFRYALPSMLFFFIIIKFGEGPVFEGANRAMDNFFERVSILQEKGEQSRRLVFGLDRFDDLNNFPDPILGVGAGATYQGATILFGKSDAVLGFGYYESEFVQSFLEGGIVLLLLRIALIITLLKSLPFRFFIKLFLFFCMIYGMPIIYNVYNAAFLLMGIALVVNTIYWQNIEKKGNMKMKATSESSL